MIPLLSFIAVLLLACIGLLFWSVFAMITVLALRIEDVERREALRERGML